MLKWTRSFCKSGYSFGQWRLVTASGEGAAVFPINLIQNRSIVAVNTHGIVETLICSLQIFQKLITSKGLLRCGITVRLDFGKKDDTELRAEFLGKVRYGNTVLYFPYRTLSVLQ